MDRRQEIRRDLAIIIKRAHDLLDPERIKPKTIDTPASIYAQLEAMISVVNMAGLYQTDFEAWANASDEDFIHDAEGILNNFDPAGLGLGTFQPLFTTVRFA